ncbi:aldehyde dehydrogenase family protein [Streptomyces sp. NPDC013187]|uniref:aldehyde dehydrogenase family protein n=1 Tax=Streptomyces sp. NPDC013187 TaxID=3364865 RepID=UPI0036A9DE50
MPRAITLEVGKTITEARSEVDYAAAYFRWYAEEAVRRHARSTPFPDGRSHIVTVAEPVGPCLLITPWNVPLVMAARKVAAALAAGRTAVLKPAELTPLSSLVLGEPARGAGAPEGVLTVITSSDAAAVTTALPADPRLRMSFTGSTPVGRLLLQSGARVLRTSMELGGNAPFLVFDDADMGRAVAEMMDGRPEGNPLRGLGFPRVPVPCLQRHRPVPAVRRRVRPGQGQTELNGVGPGPAASPRSSKVKRGAVCPLASGWPLRHAATTRAAPAPPRRRPGRGRRSHRCSR